MVGRRRTDGEWLGPGATKFARGELNVVRVHTKATEQSLSKARCKESTDLGGDREYKDTVNSRMFF